MLGLGLGTYFIYILNTVPVCIYFFLDYMFTPTVPHVLYMNVHVMYLYPLQDMCTRAHDMKV